MSGVGVAIAEGIVSSRNSDRFNSGNHRHGKAKHYWMTKEVPTAFLRLLLP